MANYIKVRLGGADKLYEVVQLATIRNLEQWQLTDGTEKIVLSNNRLILKKHRLKNWDIKWKLEAGTLLYKDDAEKLGRMIEEYCIR